MTGPERSKMLLQQLHEKKLTLKEFLMECAYWALSEGFDELKPKMSPSKPLRVGELEHKYENEKDVDWAKILADNPEVRGYYDLAKETEAWNLGTLAWLWQMSHFIPKEDYPSQDKIQARIRLFKESGWDLPKSKIEEILQEKVN